MQHSAYLAVIVIIALALPMACAPVAPTVVPTKPPAPAATAAPAAPTAAPKAGPAATPKPPPPTTPAAVPKPCPKYGGTLRVGLKSDIRSMDPHWYATGEDGNITYNVYNSIVKLAPDYKVEPDLAASWETPDPKTFVFQLRKGVKFHDGTPFNAEVVKFNIDRILGLVEWKMKEAPIGQKDFKAAIAAVKVVDEYTVRFEMKAPAPWFLGMLGEYAEFIASPPAMQSLKGDMTRQPAGTGPFIFVEKVDDDHLTLKRNPTYWEKDKDGCQLPVLDGVYYKILPDETVRLVNMKAGSLDFMTMVPAKDIENLRKDKDLKYMEGPGAYINVFRINASKPPLDDVNCREGLMYALDREAILRTVWFNVGRVARGCIPQAHGWVFDPQAFAHTLDLAKAKEHLDKCPAKPLKFTHLTRNQPQFVQLAEAVQAQWKKAGIESVIDVGDHEAQTAEVRKGNFVMQTGRDSGRSDPGVSLSEYYSCDDAGKPVVNNFQRYCDKKFDEMLIQANAEPNVDKRKQLLREAADRINRLALRAYFVEDVENALIRPEYDGYVVYGHGKQRFHTTHLAK